MGIWNKHRRGLLLLATFLNILRSDKRQSERNNLNHRNQLLTKHCIKCINYFFVFLAKHSSSIWLTYEEMIKSNTAERKKIASQIHQRGFKQILVLKVLCILWFFKFTIWYTSVFYLKEIFTFVPSFGFNISILALKYVLLNMFFLIDPSS